MQFPTTTLLGLAAAAAVSAQSSGFAPHMPVLPNVTYTTTVVDVLTTYCPGPTTLSFGPNTYVVTEATTMTITDCPCTLTTSVPCPSSTSAPGPLGTVTALSGTPTPMPMPMPTPPAPVVAGAAREGLRAMVLGLGAALAGALAL
ncbi:hypothetical protein P8C59_000751 [Phyllachora maydis]|uniref:Uncharacterized protein n=1 Tax=Phyllachora maydis TaxID=1825666 RepID=A0AAD9MBI8_9PEZI|nr:hypothetical protein P8C59_000751 [Phyllachora maydis]